MKNWKKYLALLAALLLVMAFAACAPAEEEPSDPPAESTEAPTNEMPTEAPTEEVTEAPTEVEMDYSAYMGKWYSGKVTLEVKEERKWVMTEDGETFVTGQLTVNEDSSLKLYDVEGMEAATLILEEDGTIYAELYMEELYNRIEDFIFTREQSDYIDMDEIIDSGLADEVVEELVPEEPIEDAN